MSVGEVDLVDHAEEPLVLDNGERAPRRVKEAFGDVKRARPDVDRGRLPDLSLNRLALACSIRAASASGSSRTKAV